MRLRLLRFPWISAALLIAGIAWCSSALSYFAVVRDRSEQARDQVLAHIDGSKSGSVTAIAGNYRHAHGLRLVGVTAASNDPADGVVVVGTKTHGFRLQSGDELLIPGQPPVAAEVRVLRPFAGSVSASYIVCGCERMPASIGLAVAGAATVAALALFVWRLRRFLRRG